VARHDPDAEVRRVWDGNAEVWARHVRARYDLYRDLYHHSLFFELIGDVSGRDVLDAGGGEGRTARILARKGARVTGVDLSERMIDLARAQERREPLGIRYEAWSICDMPDLEDDSFDAALAVMALMDCPDYEGAVREFARVLRPGGMLAYMICHPCFIYGTLGWEERDGQHVAIRVADYLQEPITRTSWQFGAAPDCGDVEPFDAVYFNRTLSSYLNPLPAHGFAVERICEPAPSDEACEKDPRLRKYRGIPHVPGVRARLEPG